MAPKHRAIPAEEWESYKEVIKGLFAQKPLAEVIKEMKQKYSFEATKSQYEAKLRLWGICKNLKREQWQELLKELDNIPSTGLKTSSGHMKTQPSIQRALRRLKKAPGAGQASRDSAPSHPLIQMASSSVDPSVEQVLRTAEGPGLPIQQTHDVPRLPGLGGASYTRESALLRLGEASAQFNPADSIGIFSSEFDDPMSIRWNFDFNSHMDWERQTALFDASGHDTLGLDLNSSRDRNWQFRATANVSPLGTSLTRRASPIGPSQPFLGTDHFFGFNPEQSQMENHGSPPAALTSSPGNLSRFFTSPQLSAQNGTLEGEHFDSWLRFPGTEDIDHITFPAGSTEQLLKELPFAKFEKYLHSQNITITNSESSTKHRVGPSFSGSFALRTLANSFYSGSRAMVQHLSDSQNPHQRLGGLLPGEGSAVISEKQMTETRLARALLFSMINGFAGLHHIPMEDILKSMGHFSTSKLLLRILEEGPPFTSRTLGDNMFRAAIEAKDHSIVQVLLERKLVDVNDVVCFSQGGIMDTPVERAASLQAIKLVRTLVEAGADVNKTHGDERHGGALRKLLNAAAGPNYLLSPSKAVTASEELIGTLEFLIRRGSKVGLNLLRTHLESFKNANKVARLISRSISPVDHQAFFKHDDNNNNTGSRSSLAGRIAEELDDNSAATIFQNIIELCERAGCSKCLETWPETLEDAAVVGAKRGHLKLVQLLIGHVHSTTRILSGAIRSGNNTLIRLTLDSDTKPELDPPPHVLARLPEWYRQDPYSHSLDRQQLYDILPTTPLAEAVRTGNADLIKLLEESGALKSLATEDRLEVLVIAAAEGGNMPYMKRLLKIASSSSYEYRPHCLAVNLALDNGHDEMAKSLLSAGAEVTFTYTSWDRLTQGASSVERINPLGVALSQKRDPALVRAILSADIDEICYRDMRDVASWLDISILSDLASIFPDFIDPMDDQPLQAVFRRCMETNNVKFCKEFLESSTSLHYLDTCLETAVGLGHSEMVGILLEMGANPFAGDILKAAIPEHTEMLQLLFGDDRKQRISPKCVGAYTLKFVMAERLGNAEVLNRLLERGLVNLTALECLDSDEHQDEMFTPLGLAVVGSSDYCETNLPAVNRLLQAGSDPNGIASTLDRGIRVGETGLMLALKTGREDVVKLLLKYGADVNKKTHLSIKRTPLQYAAELGNLDMVRLLLRHGADVNEEPAIRSGGTALQFAAISGYCNVAAELLERGAQLHALPSKVNGRWPLEGAAEHGRIDMIEFLWKANKCFLDDAGFQKRQCLRAMDFARSNGHLGCRDLVAELSGISVDELDSEDYGVPWLAY